MLITELLTLPVSWISSTTSRNVVHQCLGDALAAIRNGKQQSKILQMREVVEIDHDRYDEIKGSLPANIFSGKFTGGHAITNIIEYNCLMTLDIDKLNDEQLVKVKQDLLSDEYVFAFWLSPSGKGYKGLVLLDYGETMLSDKVYWHKIAFSQLFQYYKDRYDFELDIKCKDVPRLCFVSFDPDIVVKDNAIPFKVEPIEAVKIAQHEAVKHRHTFSSYKGTNYRHNEPGRNKQDDKDIVTSIVKYLEKNHISITQSYDDWYSVAMAIVTAFNYDVGVRFYLRLCRLDGPRHDEDASLSMLRYCYEHSNYEINLGTLIYLARKKGYKTTKGST